MIKEAITKEEIEEVFNIRNLAQGIPLDKMQDYDLDAPSITLIDIEKDKIVGATTAFKIKEREYELRHLGVLPEYQRKGIGKKLIKKMEEVLKQKGTNKITISARTYLENFYNCLGYKKIGDKYGVKGFVEKGIFHQDMKKEI